MQLNNSNKPLYNRMGKHSKHDFSEQTYSNSTTAVTSVDDHFKPYIPIETNHN